MFLRKCAVHRFALRPARSARSGARPPSARVSLHAPRGLTTQGSARLAPVGALAGAVAMPGSMPGSESDWDLEPLASVEEGVPLENAQPTTHHEVCSNCATVQLEIEVGNRQC